MTTKSKGSGSGDEESRGQLNSVQLNVVTLVNMARASATGSLTDSMYMMDNSIGGSGHGTGQLETVCKRGQVLNWIIRPIDMEKGADGNWPPMPKISSLVVLDHERGDENDVATKRIFSELKIYGMPDKMRSPYTPVYYYWAGTILSTAEPGTYHYRLVLELEQEHSNDKLYLNTVDYPSIRVL